MSEAQGYLAHEKMSNPLGIPKSPGHSPTVGSYGVAVSYKQGTPVHLKSGWPNCAGG